MVRAIVLDLGDTGPVYGKRPAILRAVEDAPDLDALRAAFLHAVEAACVKSVCALSLNTSETGAMTLTPIIEVAPLGISEQQLSARWPGLADAFVEFMNGRECFDVSAPPRETYSDALRAILRYVVPRMGASHCLAIPVHRDGTLRGGAFFMSDQAVGEDGAAFLNALCELGYDRLITLKQSPPAVNPLTVRQREALSLCAQGKSDWEIAQLLDISPTTAHEHIETVKRKLQVRTRVQAAVLAAQKGWI